MYPVASIYIFYLKRRSTDQFINVLWINMFCGSMIMILRIDVKNTRFYFELISLYLMSIKTNIYYIIAFFPRVLRYFIQGSLMESLLWQLTGPFQIHPYLHSGKYLGWVYVASGAVSGFSFRRHSSG